MPSDRLAEMEAFVRVAEAGSFSAAARLIGSTQPALSKLVSALETRIRARLLVRTTRSLSLTEQGASYLGQCKRILADIEDANVAAKEGHAAILGRMRINTSALLAGKLVLPTVLAFQQLHPALSAEVVMDDKRVDPVEERADLIVRLGASADSGLVQRKAGRARLGLFASPDYLRRMGSPRRRADLATHAMVLIGDRARMDSLSTYVDPARPLQRSSLGVSNAVLARDAAMLGAGIAPLPQFLVTDDVTAGRLVEVLSDLPLPWLEITFLHPFGATPPSKVRAFTDFALSQWRQAGLLAENAD